MSAGQRAAVLAEHGYHELDFWYPVLRLREAGAEVSVVGPSRDETYRSALGYPVIPDDDFAAAARADYDVLIVPGGAARLGENAEARQLIQAHLGRGRTVALLGADDSHSLLTAEADAGARGTILRYASPDDLPALVPALLGYKSTPMRGTRVLVLAESQYQELELWFPVLRFREAGAEVAVAAPESGALYSSKLGYPVRSDVSVADVDPADVDVLVIPGGFAPEAMRRSAALLDLVRKCHANGQLVAAICHAGWVLISAGIAKDRQLTCVPVIRDDLISAGANYVDQPVVRDGNLITSRLPNDLDVFCAEIIRAALEHTGPRGDGHSWPSGERRSHAAFTVPAVLRQAPGGRATANYRTVSAAAELRRPDRCRNHSRRETDVAVIRTVLGDIPSEQAGATLAHEHILYAYPGADLDHRTQFDFEEVADRVAGTLRGGLEDNGVATLVEMTPAEVYRHPPLMKAVSERSGVNIIAVTGFFPETMGIPYYWRRQTVRELTEFFVTDLTQGMIFQAQQTCIRAGAIKIATGGEGVSTEPSPVGERGSRITKVEDRIIRAAAHAQQQVGCAINTHTDPNDYAVTNPGIEQLDILEEEGVDPRKVIIGHPFIHPRDMDQVAEICARGASVNIDHVGIPWKHDSTDQIDGLLAERIADIIERGYAGQITLSYDRWFFNPRAQVTDLDPEFLNAKVPYNHMFDSFLPRLAKLGIGEEVIRGFLVDTPRRIFELTPA